MKKRRRVLIGGLIILGAVSYLVFTGARNTMVYYLTVEEVHAQGSSLFGKGVRIAGKVVPNSIERDRQGLGLKFMMMDIPAKTNDTESGRVSDRTASLAGRDRPKTLPVRFTGITPDMFKDRADVIIEGRVLPNGVFEAKTLMTQCPSKYESDPASNSGDYTTKRKQPLDISPATASRNNQS